MLNDPYQALEFRYGTAWALQLAGSATQSEIHLLRTDFQAAVGENDEIVSLEPIQELVEKSEAKRRELLMIPFADHAPYFYGNYYKQILSAQIDFIDSYK